MVFKSKSKKAEEQWEEQEEQLQQLQVSCCSSAEKHEKQSIDEFSKQKRRSYWRVAVYVATAADGSAQVVKVDRRQTLL